MLLNLIGFLPSHAIGTLQDCIAEGLAAMGVDHDVAQHITRHGLHHHTHARDEVKGARGLDARTAALNEIDSGRQAFQDDAVFKLFLFRMLAEGQRTRTAGNLFHARLDARQVLGVVGIQIGVTLQRGAKNTDGQATDVAQVVQSQRLSLIGHGYLPRHLDTELGIGHGGPLVLASLGYHVGLREVAIEGCQRVQRGEVVGGTQGQMAQGTTVACLTIVVLEPLPLVELHTHDAQQVVTKGLTVLTPYEERLVDVGLDLGKHLRMGHGSLPVALAACVGIVAQLGIVFINLGQHGGIDSLQGLVRDLAKLFLQPCNSRTQGVRSHL